MHHKFLFCQPQKTYCSWLLRVLTLPISFPQQNTDCPYIELKQKSCLLRSPSLWSACRVPLYSNQYSLTLWPHFLPRDFFLCSIQTHKKQGYVGAGSPVHPIFCSPAPCFCMLWYCLFSKGHKTIVWQGALETWHFNMRLVPWRIQWLDEQFDFSCFSHLTFSPYIYL